MAHGRQYCEVEISGFALQGLALLTSCQAEYTSRNVCRVAEALKPSTNCLQELVL